jgi:membrane protein implicated in regulation of membrane protease activity
VPDLRVLFIGSFVLGLVLGVRAMLNGVERASRAAGRHFSLNTPTVAGFLTVFGLAGFILDRFTTLSPVLDVVLAAVIGALSAVGAVVLVAGWAIPGAKAEVVDERYELQGCIARVVEVHEDGVTGAITFEINGMPQRAAAHGLDGARLALGTDVAIERVENGIAYVEPWAQVEARL